MAASRWLATPLREEVATLMTRFFSSVGLVGMKGCPGALPSRYGEGRTQVTCGQSIVHDRTDVAKKVKCLVSAGCPDFLWTEGTAAVIAPEYTLGQTSP